VRSAYASCMWNQEEAKVGFETGIVVQPVNQHTEGVLESMCSLRSVQTS